MNTCSVPDHGVAERRQARDAAGDDAAVDGVARRVRARVGDRAGRAPGRRRAARLVVERVEDVDVGLRREVRVQRQPEEAAVPEVVGRRCVKSAKIVGVVSVSESNTLMRPLFSATNTRPSLANCTAVGCDEPGKDDRLLKAARQGDGGAGRGGCHEERQEEQERKQHSGSGLRGVGVATARSRGRSMVGTPRRAPQRGIV